jgi:ABC-2 type transport system ATP-binding protein
MTTSSHILEIRHLTKIYNHDLFSASKTALNDLSCVFPKGKCTGFMGHNGAGKTSTIRIVFKLIKADKGEILFKGKPIEKEDFYNIGYMPETNKLPVTLTPFEILDHQLKVLSPPSFTAAMKKEAIQNKLNEVGLWDARNTQTRRLSKGMGRRVAWAQATIHNPELIILDEPFSGMDPQCREQMIEWMSNYRKDGRTIVLCSHELTMISQLCDEIHILKNGSLVYSSIHPLSDNPADRTPSSLYTLHLAGLSEKEAELFKDSPEAANPCHKISSGYLLQLNYTSYEQAVSCLGSALAKGYIVAHFGEEKRFSPSQLLPYF